MKIFLYSLKVWLTVALCTLLPVLFLIQPEWKDGSQIVFLTILFAIPFGFTIWLATKMLYKKDLSVKKKKTRVILWSMLVLALTILNVTPGVLTQTIPAAFFSTSLLVAGGMLLFSGGLLTLAVALYRLPSRRPVTVTDNLKGRHILLRIQENNLLLRGVVLSELNIWPIKIKLQDNSPHSLLDLHSFQEDELFTSLNYQTSVKVKVFTADRKEFLFTGTLELDHTLN